MKPASINTPFIDHARSYMDEEPEYAPPVYAPEAVARPFSGVPSGPPAT